MLRDFDVAAALNSTARILVVAPHPDDETLAAGGLLQRARAAGAAIRIVFLTDGDNNPWPQRWLERRWRIDAVARARWAARRRAEADAANRILGLDGSDIVRFGWPDLGVTARLVDDTPVAVAVMTHAITTFAPTLIVAPALHDRHPDHAAAHVLVQLALRHSGAPVPCLDYGIHGATGDAATLALHAEEVAVKRAAVMSYASQVSLSRARLLSQVTSVERFGRPAAAQPDPPWHPRVPWSLELLVVRAEQVSVRGWHGAANLRAEVSAATGAGVTWYAKLRCAWPLPYIFDHYGWWRGA